MNATVKSLLVLCVVTVMEPINAPVFGDSAGNGARDVVTNVIERLRSGGEFDSKRILHEGTNSVQYLLPYLKDTDSRTRGNVAIILGVIPDARAVLPLASMLQDDDDDVRMRAINALYKITRVHQIKDELTISPLLTSLAAYGRKADRLSYMAVLIFGELAGKESVPAVKHLRDEAASMKKKGGGAEVIGERTEGACLKVLAKLGDSKARKEVVALLENSDPEIRVRGIDIVHYVGKDMAAALVPMLQDERDALDVSPSMRGEYFLRVCDVAAHTLRFIKRPHMELQEQMRDSHRYSKEERETIARTGSLGK